MMRLQMTHLKPRFNVMRFENFCDLLQQENFKNYETTKCQTIVYKQEMLISF